MTVQEQAAKVLLGLESPGAHAPRCPVDPCSCNLGRNAVTRAAALADAGLLHVESTRRAAPQPK